MWEFVIQDSDHAPVLSNALGAVRLSVCWLLFVCLFVGGNFGPISMLRSIQQDTAIPLCL